MLVGYTMLKRFGVQNRDAVTPVQTRANDMLDVIDANTLQRKRTVAIPAISPPAAIRTPEVNAAVHAEELEARGTTVEIEASCNFRVVHLRGPWDLLGLLLPVLGRVRLVAGTAPWAGGRNVCFGTASAKPAFGAAAPATVDTRTIARRWSDGFAVVEEIIGLQFCSLQFFDAAGVAVHRIYLLDDSNFVAWARLVTCFRAPMHDSVPGILGSSTSPAKGLLTPRRIGDV